MPDNGVLFVFQFVSGHMYLWKDMFKGSNYLRIKLLCCYLIFIVYIIILYIPRPFSPIFEQRQQMDLADPGIRKKFLSLGGNP